MNKTQYLVCLQFVHILYIVKLYCACCNNMVEYALEDSRQKKQRNGWHHHAETCVCVKNQAGTVVSITYIHG